MPRTGLELMSRHIYALLVTKLYASYRSPSSLEFHSSCYQEIDQLNFLEKNGITVIRRVLELCDENGYEEEEHDFVLALLASVYEDETEYFQYHKSNLYR